MTLLLEPLNSTYDHPGYWLTSSDRGGEICRELDYRGVFGLEYMPSIDDEESLRRTLEHLQ